MKSINLFKIKNWSFAVLFTIFAGGPLLAVVAPVTASVSAAATCAKGEASRILTFPVWYRGLNVSQDDCTIASPVDVGGPSAFIWRIVLNVIDIGLQAVGYITVIFILYGGFQFLISQGSPDGSAKARKTILNAVIGLVISIASVAVVNLIIGVMK